jgi:hypothetical protein
MDTQKAGTRRTTFRAIGWIAITALLALAVLGPASGAALASHVDPVLVDIQPGAQPDCADLGFDSGFKIDSGELTDGTFGSAGFEVEVDFSGDDGGQPTELAFEVVAGSALVDGVFVKGGNDGNLYTYPGGEDADEGLEAPDGKGISHVLICYNEDEVTTTTTTDTTTDTTTTDTTTSETTTDTTTTDTTTSETTTDTTTSETTTDTTTTDTTTETTTTDVSSTTSVNTTTTGSVSSTTGTGTITLPPTSTVDPASGSNSTLISFGLLLLAVGGLVLGLARPLATRKVDDR